MNNLAWLYYETAMNEPRQPRVALTTWPSDNPAIADTYGWILIEKGKVADGLAVLARAAAKAPDNPDIRYHHAAALARSGDSRRALDILDEVLASNQAFASRTAAEQLRSQLVSGRAAGAK